MRLYHLATLLPGRLELARTLRLRIERRIPLQRAAGHGESEALYLADPEGNGLEVYADRRPEACPRLGKALERIS